jgi:hypothetical protein
MKDNWTWQRTLTVAVIGAVMFGATDFLADIFVGGSPILVFTVRTLLFMPLFLIVISVAKRQGKAAGRE